MMNTMTRVSVICIVSVSCTWSTMRCSQPLPGVITLLQILKKKLISLGAHLTQLQKSPVKAPEKISRKSFFKDIVGIDEEAYRKLDDNNKEFFITTQAEGNKKVYILNNQQKSEQFQMGYFEQFSIEELRQLTENIENNDLSSGTGTICIVNGFLMTDKKLVDIGSIQSMPENKDAVFQVASNFNGLETVSQHQNIDTQLLGDYCGDSTQGPFASISAFPGLMLRHYYMFYEKYKDKGSHYWRQRADQHDQINFLDGLTSLTMSKAGYVILDNVVSSNPTDEDLKKMKVGYHRDIEVVFGQLQDGLKNHYRIFDKHQIINQVFTAAVDFAGTNSKHYSNPNAQAWGKIILQAAYEGTIRVAAAQGKKRVILTLVGGGVFANDSEWIAQAIYRMKDFIKKSGLQVFVSVFGGGNDGLFIDKLKEIDTEKMVSYWVDDHQNPYLL